MTYTAVIRTLGKTGKKYQLLLDSLCSQSIQPSAIVVYIAKGYPIPKETCGKETYVFVEKGMVSQRALSYEEVKTDWILFLDDDLSLPPYFVEQLFSAIEEHQADVVSPDIFDNASRSLVSEVLMTMSGRMRARRRDQTWAYKVMHTCGYSYNKYPQPGKAYLSQTNAGACFLCRKSDFLKLQFQDERWMDKMGYAIGDDQVMFYKMYLMGFKQLTLFGTGIIHLDAGGNLGNKEKAKKLVEGDYFFRYVFWHRFLQEPERNPFKRLWNIICLWYFYGFGFFISMLKGQFEMMKFKKNGLLRGRQFVHSEVYYNLPKVINKVSIQ